MRCKAQHEGRPFVNANNAARTRSGGESPGNAAIKAPTAERSAESVYYKQISRQIQLFSGENAALLRVHCPESDRSVSLVVRGARQLSQGPPGGHSLSEAGGMARGTISDATPAAAWKLPTGWQRSKFLPKNRLNWVEELRPPRLGSHAPEVSLLLGKIVRGPELGSHPSASRR